MTASEKPHRGRIYEWREIGRVVVGVFERFNGRESHTSALVPPVLLPLRVKREGGEIETLNSRYTLVGAEGTPMPNVGPYVLLVERSIRGQVMARADAVVYDCRSHDYGLASDDTRATGLEHISVTLNEDGSDPCFTVPRVLLRPAPWLADKTVQS